ncbi:MAG: M48 family metalloprotease [Lachnospiraceae bacterium]
MNRLYGVMKVTVALILNYIFFNMFLDIKWSIGITFMIAILTYLGEYVGLIQDGAIPLKNIEPYYKEKLEISYQILCEQGKQRGINLKEFRLYLIPREEIQAYAYGKSSIGITKGLLETDEFSIASVMGHECGHCFALDSYLKRILFLDITIVLFALSVMGFLGLGLIWFIFIMLCLVGLCGGFLSVYLTGFLGRVIKGIFSGLQRLVLLIYQTALGALSRRMEYRADYFVAKTLDMGEELSFFLNCFAADNGFPRTLREIMYASHPATHKRVARIQKQTKKYLI